MTAKVEKWGRSQGVKLSEETLERAQMNVGDALEVRIGDGEIVLKKTATPKYDIAELVARIPKGYKPQEVDAGDPVGREEW